jgi:hypothetical protein
MRAAGSGKSTGGPTVRFRSTIVYWDVKKETALIEQVKKSFETRQFDQVCKIVGKFIEAIATTIYSDAKGAKPKNAKAAMDFIMDSKLVPRPLGAKMHVVRELRNVEAHNLPYVITEDDAKLAYNIFNDVKSWVNKEELAREWKMIISMFNRAELRMNGRTNHSMFFSKILPALHSAFDRAVILRLRSLGIESKPTDDLFLRLKRLARHGFNLRNPAWRNLVDLRNHGYHDGGGDLASRIEAMRSQMGELRKALERLDPLQQGKPERGSTPVHVVT